LFRALVRPVDVCKQVSRASFADLQLSVIVIVFHILLLPTLKQKSGNNNPNPSLLYKEIMTGLKFFVWLDLALHG
jgi:hypothetical protein